MRSAYVGSVEIERPEIEKPPARCSRPVVRYRQGWRLGVAWGQFSVWSRFHERSSHLCRISWYSASRSRAGRFPFPAKCIELCVDVAFHLVDLVFHFSAPSVWFSVSWVVL